MYKIEELLARPREAKSTRNKRPQLEALLAH
jgi:hypothetical protein